jgi:hypothetical protein
MIEHSGQAKRNSAKLKHKQETIISEQNQNQQNAGRREPMLYSPFHTNEHGHIRCSEQRTPVHPLPTNVLPDRC